jgi:hypothetical protein
MSVNKVRYITALRKGTNDPESCGLYNMGNSLHVKMYKMKLIELDVAMRDGVFVYYGVQEISVDTSSKSARLTTLIEEFRDVEVLELNVVAKKVATKTKEFL